MRALKLLMSESTLKSFVVTIQAREGIETCEETHTVRIRRVTIQAREGIETQYPCNILIDVVAKKVLGHPVPVPGKKI